MGAVADPKINTVGEVTRAVKTLLEAGFPSIWVCGEISTYRPASSGHVYLTLKDAEAQIRAVIWRATAARLRFDPRDGIEVIARGRLDVYLPHGEYKLIIEEMQPKGLGAQEIALRQLKEKLFQLGYFDPARKKPLPRFPNRVALVTSPTGAAVRDMLEVLARRWAAAEVWVCPVRVQGDGAAEEIAAAIELLNQLSACDVMLVGRGGGSSDDLWAFNAEGVARAIFNSSIPVVSAVGHEIDLTLADLVADFRALTPSEAAERAVPNRQELLDGLRGLHRQLTGLLGQRYETARGRLDDLAQRGVFRLPFDRIRVQEQRLDDWSERLRRAGRQLLDRRRERLQAEAARLETLSPLNVLARGYSLTRSKATGAVIRTSEQVRPGDRLVTTVQTGTVISRVEEMPVSATPDAS